MNNIEVSRVMCAYEAGVVEPGFEGWGSADHNCGCALTALALYEHPERFSNLQVVLESIEKKGSKSIRDALNLTWPYMLGFTEAFDGLLSHEEHFERMIVWEASDKNQYQLGRAHGKAVRYAVFGKYFPGSYHIRNGAEF